jgi:hypothetical protein
MAKAKKLPPESVGKEIMWPPPGGTQIEAWPYQNWWDLASAATPPRDVWDIILFNFDTINGREINYYMRTKLKCFKTKKGNWMFGQEDGNPSILYMPPAGWKWTGIGQPQPPVRPAMSGLDYAVALNVIAVLRGPYTAKLKLRQGHYRIDGPDFIRIADRVANGTISVFGTDANSGDARYAHEEQAFYLRRTFNAFDSAKIVHEAVHAIFDLEKKHNILTKEDEAMAYLAETAWIQDLMATDRRLLFHDLAGEVFQRAHELWFNKYRVDPNLTYEDFKPLQDSIASSGHYGGVANDVATYDGIFEMGAV